MSKVWIFNNKKEKKIGLIEVDEKRCDFKCTFAPPRQVKYFYRKPHYWAYVPYGRTKQEAWDNATEYKRRQIKNLEDQLYIAKRDLQVKFGNRPDDECKCDKCDNKATHIQEPDPYLKDIENLEELWNLCDKCYYRSCDDT